MNYQNSITINMIEIAQNIWLPLISFIVALFGLIGGVPGIISIYQEHKNLARFAAYLHRISPIYLNDTTGKAWAGVFMELTIGNQGKEAIVPLAYQLDCIINGEIKPFLTARIPEGFTIAYPEGTHTCNNVQENDIQQRKKAITRESPVYGFIMFLSKDVSINEINASYMEMDIVLKCTDLFGKVHPVLLNRDLISTPISRPA